MAVNPELFSLQLPDPLLLSVNRCALTQRNACVCVCGCRSPHLCIIPQHPSPKHHPTPNNSQDNSTAALAAAAMQRSVAGVLSALLSFKRRPSQIRYQAASPAARQVRRLSVGWMRGWMIDGRLGRSVDLTFFTDTHTYIKVAAAVAQAIQADQIFDFRRPPGGQEGPTLVILDRRDDPVTPL